MRSIQSLYPVQINNKYFVGFFNGDGLIRISKYFDSELQMRQVRQTMMANPEKTQAMIKSAQQARASQESK